MKVADKLFLDRFRIAIVATLTVIMFLFAGKVGTVKEASAQAETMVTFETNGGTKVDPVSISWGDDRYGLYWQYGFDISQQYGFWFWVQESPGSPGHTITTSIIAYPTKPGNVLDAWYINEALTDGGTDWPFYSKQKNATYYAKWAPLAYTVQFIDQALGTLDTFTIPNGNMNALWFMYYADDGAVIYGRSSNTGESSNMRSEYKLPYPERNGYCFGGWCYDSAGTKLLNTARSGSNSVKNDNKIVSDTTLYARWFPLQTIVKYDSRGGSALPADTLMISDTSKIFGSKCVSRWKLSCTDTNFSFYCTPSAYYQSSVYSSTHDYPTREGYIFAGWYSDTTGDPNATIMKNKYVEDGITLYARWVKKEIIVTYNLLDGNAPSNSDTLRWDSTVTKKYLRGWSIEYNRRNPVMKLIDHATTTRKQCPGSQIPIRDGYIFRGWYADSAFSTLFFWKDSDWQKGLYNYITGDTMLFAKWQKAPLVKFNTMGGKEQISPFLLSDSNWIETPWFGINYKSIDEGFHLRYSDHNIESEIIPYPTRDGYIFSGWYADSLCNNRLGSVYYSEPPNSLKNEITIYAGWRKNPIIVRHEMNGGDPIPDDSLYPHFNNSYNAWYLSYTDSNYCYLERYPDYVSFSTYKQNETANPTRENYQFTGWYSDSACTQKMYVNISYYPSYGGPYLDKEYPHVTGDRDTVLYAGWKYIPADTIHICYNSMNGEELTYDTLVGKNWDVDYIRNGFYLKKSVGNDSYVYTDTLPYPKPKDENLVFAGWYNDSLYTNKFEDSRNVIVQDDTLYAKWSPKYYFISYDTDGGTLIDDDTLENINCDISWGFYNDGDFSFFGRYNFGEQFCCDTNAHPTKDSCYYKGWYFSDYITHDTTLKVRWIKYSWLVHYNSMGGTEIADDTLFNTKDAYKWEMNQTDSGYNFKSDFPLKPYPTREGYIFAGWYSDSTYKNYGGWVDAHDATFYAKWIKQYNIVVNPMNGEKNSTLAYHQITADRITFEYDDENSLVRLKDGYAPRHQFDSVPYPQWEGHVFTGWFTDSLYRNMVFDDAQHDTYIPRVNSSYYICSDTVLYARWDSNSYVVKFDTRGGTKLSDITLPNNTIAKDWYFTGGSKYFRFRRSRYNPILYTDNYPVPTRDGYRYFSMYTDSLCKHRASGDELVGILAPTIYFDTTLYVKWLPLFKISFNSMGGTPCESVRVDSNSVIYGNYGTYYANFDDDYLGKYSVNMATPTREGFVFLGWYCDSLYTEVPYKITKETVLYARWWDPKNPTVDVSERPHVSDRTPIIAVSNLHPNPATDEIGLSISLLRKAIISISIYDASGLKVAVLMQNEVFGAGERELTFAIPSELSSGSYFIEVDSGSVSARQIRKFVIIK